jgi:hypothetical protein
MNLIGVSKLMCLACNTYIEELNTRRKVEGKMPYVLTGTSGKAHAAWLLPPGDLRDIVINRIDNALKAAISGLAKMLGHRRIHSGGSDSSTGSNRSTPPIFGENSEDKWKAYFKFRDI